MPHLSPRELVLLCSPLLLIGIAGFVLSRRKPTADDKSLLEFRIEKPSTLEAFRGIQCVLVVRPKGPMRRLTGISPAFELQTAAGVRRFDSSTFWKNVLKETNGGGENTRFLVDLKSIPPGKLRFEAKTLIATSPSTTGNSTSPLKESWTLHREQIKPVTFVNIARPPLVVLRSIKLTRVALPGEVTGECTFDLTGAAMNDQTPAEFSFSGRVNRNGSQVSSGWGVRPIDSSNPKQRVWEWTMDFPPAANSKTIARAAGRVSVDSRWPLAFESESFDLAKAKVGQQLKFKMWPVPRPTP